MSESTLRNEYYSLPGEECSSGRASRRSIYAPNTTRRRGNERYKSKWRHRNDCRKQNASDYSEGLTTPATIMMRNNNIDPTKQQHPFRIK